MSASFGCECNDSWFPFTGVDDNETIRVFGSGGADPDGNQPGDLYVTIKVTCMSLILHDALASFFSPPHNRYPHLYFILYFIINFTYAMCFAG